MQGNWSRTVEPTLRAISIAEAKAQARLTHSDEDGVFASMIRVAEGEAETYMQRGLLTQTLVLALPDWPERIWLPQAAPLQSVTSVEYVGTDGSVVTLASTNYIVDSTTRPACIVAAPTSSWPQLQVGREAWRVRVTYVVGWTSPALVPELIKHGLKMYVTHLDMNRDGTEGDGGAALRAAHSKWSDRVFPEPWKP